MRIYKGFAPRNNGLLPRYFRSIRAGREAGYKTVDRVDFECNKQGVLDLLAAELVENMSDGVGFAPLVIPSLTEVDPPVKPPNDLKRWSVTRSSSVTLPSGGTAIRLTAAKEPEPDPACEGGEAVGSIATRCREELEHTYDPDLIALLHDVLESIDEREEETSGSPDGD